MFCENCGKKLDEFDKSCPQCGKETNNFRKRKKELKKEKRANLLQFVIFILNIIFLVYLGWSESGIIASIVGLVLAIVLGSAFFEYFMTRDNFKSVIRRINKGEVFGKDFVDFKPSQDRNWGIVCLVLLAFFEALFITFFYYDFASMLGISFSWCVAAFCLAWLDFFILSKAKQ